MHFWQRFIRASIFILMLIIMDYSLGCILKKFYYCQKSGLASGLTYSLTSCKEQIIILGNSRAQHHFNPKIIEDSLKLSCLNAGIDGGHSIFLPYAQIMAICRRYRPKMIILEFSPNSIIFDSQSYERLSILLPYYDTLKFLRPLIESRSNFEKIKFFSKVYPYNSNLITILKNSLFEDTTDYKLDGYVPILRTIKNVNIRSTSKTNNNMIYDKAKIMALDSIIRICKNYHIELIIINSPVFKSNVDQSSIDRENPAIQLIRNHRIPFLNFENDLQFSYSSELFADQKHLNYLGSEKFSSSIAHQIKKITANN